MATTTPLSAAEFAAQLQPVAAETSVFAAPLLVVCIDVEEEFDWSQPFSRTGFRLDTVDRIPEAVYAFNAKGVQPTLLVDYPVLADPNAVRPLQELYEQGTAAWGTQLHGWTTPPFVEELTPHNSYAGNLPLDVEREKLKVLTDAFTAAFGTAPKIFRSGRFGFGPNTAKLLVEANYRIDMSMFANRDFSSDGGPDFSDIPAAPAFSGRHRELLLLPATTGAVGVLRRHRRRVHDLCDTPLGRAVHMRGLLSRLGLLNWTWLSPEGVPLAMAKALTRRLARDGQKVFIITFHSPSLVPGNTSYVRTDAELRAFRHWLDSYVDFFLDEIKGVPATPEEIYTRLYPAAA